MRKPDCLLPGNLVRRIPNITIELKMFRYKSVRDEFIRNFVPDCDCDCMDKVRSVIKNPVIFIMRDGCYSYLEPDELNVSNLIKLERFKEWGDDLLNDEKFKSLISILKNYVKLAESELDMYWFTSLYDTAIKLADYVKFFCNEYNERHPVPAKGLWEIKESVSC